MKLGLPLACFLLCVLTVAVTACGETIIKEDDGGSPQAETRVLVGDEYRPGGKWCPTLRTCFTNFTWAEYGADKAVGYGDAKDCAPGGPCLKHPDTAVVVSDPKTACGELRFTHLEMFGNGFDLRRDIGCIEYTIVDSREPEQAAAPTTTTTPTSPSQEFSGRCTSETKATFPVAGKPGFQNLQTLEAPCDFAVQVATEWVADYGRDCYYGCVKFVEGLRCESDVGSVNCSAARSEVRFDLEQSD